MPKPLTVWITTNCGKFLKRWEYQTTSPEATIRTGHGTIDWFQIKKEVILSPCLCREHHEKCWAGWSTSWNQDCWKKCQKPQIHRWHHPYGRNWKGTKELLDERKEQSEKAGLKLNIQKTEDPGSWSNHFMANRWGNNGHNDRLYFPGLQNQMISHISNYMRTQFTVKYTYLNLLNLFLSLSLIPIPFLLFLFFLFFHISLFLCFL